MARISISEARGNLSGVVKTSQTEVVFLERDGRPAAVLISPERYEELLEAFEEAQDVTAFDESLADENPNIPWDQVKSDLGWT
jgi:prevent-host-death family protein